MRNTSHRTQTDRLPLYALLGLICASFIVLTYMFMLVIADARTRMIERVAESVPPAVADTVSFAHNDPAALQQVVDAHVLRTPGVISLGVAYQGDDGMQYVAVHDAQLEPGTRAVDTEATAAAQVLARQVVTRTLATGHLESAYGFAATERTPAGYVRAVIDPTLVGTPVERNMVRLVLLSLALLGLVFFITAWLLGTGKQRAAHRQLTRALGHTQTFLSQTLHEIQTPVTVIAGYAHMLDAETLPEAARAQVTRITHAADVLTRFVEQALLAHTIEHGSVPVRLTSIRPQHVVHAAIAAVEKKYRARKPRIAHTSAATQGAQADERLLGIVLEQLLANAVVHASSPVHVDVLTEGSDVCIRVTDSGPGMDTEALRALQEKWERTQPSQGLRGSGLGLWIARELTQRMGGRLELTSTPQAGTIATVRLPRVLN